RGVDAPFADREWVAAIGLRDVVRIGRAANDGQYFSHVRNAGVDWVWVGLWNVRVKQRDSIDGIAHASVVIVFAKEEVGGWTRIGRHHVRGHNCGGIVPAEPARELLGLQVGAKVQQKAD